jgi:hypothetical protein
MSLAIKFTIKYYIPFQYKLLLIILIKQLIINGYKAESHATRPPYGRQVCARGGLNYAFNLAIGVTPPLVFCSLSTNISVPSGR